MKKIFKMSLALAMTGVLALGIVGCSKPAEPSGNPKSGSGETGEVKQIGILQLVEHPALDASKEGFIAALAEGGYVDGQNIAIDFQNAQNDQSNLKTISQKFVNDKKDLVLAIATPSAQTMATETTEIPILGTAITDYEKAELVTANDAPGGNVSGTSDKTPVKEQLELMLKILPDAKKIGVMYNSSEANSQIQANMAEEAAKELGLTCEFGTVTTSNDIPQAIQALVGKVDALYIPTDNTFASAMATVAATAEEAKMPVIVGENGMCETGGLASVGIDYYNLGYQTGKMAIRVLEGEDISAMPIEFTENADVSINLDMAAAIGITIPQDILDSAAIIIKDGAVDKKAQ